MNQSTVLAVLAASAVGQVSAQWHDRLSPLLTQIEGLLGSFFGRGNVARGDEGI